MVQSVINVSENLDRVLNIIKAQHGFKNKNQAIEFVLQVYAESFLEPEVRPEYLDKLKNMEKENNFIEFNSIEELRKSIENA